MTVQSNCVIVAQIHILVKSDKFRFLSIIPTISFLLFPITCVSYCWLLTHTAQQYPAPVTAGLAIPKLAPRDMKRSNLADEFG